MNKFFLILVAVLFSGSVIASAQTSAFSTNLSVGKSGTDVSVLQTWLIAHGYHIPSIESGKISKGYFGSQTKAAVIAYQTKVGLPMTGFVGPLTRGKLNGGAVVMTPPASWSCPAGYTCTATPGAVVIPPATASAPGTITTPGVVGTLAVSIWSTPSGIVAYKGQSYDVASYKVQASASDMAIQNLTLDFDVRLWLYAGAVTVKDDTGAVVGQVNGLNSGNFSELTVGTQYRLSVPVNNYVVRATQSRYLTVNISFLPSSDRSTGTVTVTQMQVRAVDGTGVSDTQTNTGGTRTFSYQGSGGSQIVATLSSTNPSVGFVEVSTSVVTDNTPLAVYSLKSTNKPAILHTLKVNVSISGNGNVAGTLTNVFNSIALKVGSTIVANGTIGTVSGTAGGYQVAQVTFADFSATLPADQYTDIALIGRFSPSTGNRFEGIVASTTLDLTNAANISVEDASYASLTPNSIVLVSNQQQITASTISLAGMPTVTYGSLNRINSTGSTTQQFTFVVPLIAGKNAIYISKDVYTAISTSTNPIGLTISSLNFSDDDTSGDGSTYFYIAPGQAKTFTAVYSASGLSTSGGILQLAALNYGTDSTAVGGLLYNPDVTNILTATLFH